jgi:hypothetical protein
MIYDWNKFGRSRVALFNRIMAWFITCQAILSWPLFGRLALRDWTVIVAPLVITAGAVTLRVAMRKVYRAEVDYSAIASMERSVWGEAFKHAGAPDCERQMRMTVR